MNGSFQVFSEESVGKFKLLLSESGIWLGKILGNDISFVKFLEAFPHHCFVLYLFPFISYIIGVRNTNTAIIM